MFKFKVGFTINFAIGSLIITKMFENSSKFFTTITVVELCTKAGFVFGIKKITVNFLGPVRVWFLPKGDWDEFGWSAIGEGFLNLWSPQQNWTYMLCKQFSSSHKDIFFAYLLLFIRKTKLAKTAQNEPWFMEPRPKPSALHDCSKKSLSKKNKYKLSKLQSRGSTHEWRTHAKKKRLKIRKKSLLGVKPLQYVIRPAHHCVQ